MRSIIVENADGPGPYGAKGCGEGALAAVPAAIVCALADAGVAMNELPLTPERVWRRIREQQTTRPPRRKGDMSELNRATILGHRHDGPGHGGRAGPRRPPGDPASTSAPRRSTRAQGTVGVVEGVLERLEVPVTDGGSLRFESDPGAAVEGAEILARGDPRAARAQAAGARRDRGAPLRRGDHRLQHLRHPDHEDRGELAHPERVIGWHWSNPPHLIPMNEVINGERTAPAVTAAIEELTRRIGYHPVTLKKEVPGFVENRVLYAIMRECLALVDEGVIDVEGLDLACKWGIGYKLAVMPPIQLLDMAGLDIYTAVASFLNADLSNEQRHLEDRHRPARRGPARDQDRAAASSSTRPSASRSSSSSGARRSSPCGRR